MQSPFKNTSKQTITFPCGTYTVAEIKRLAYIACMSQETMCFTADLWLDGKKVATLQNNGQGEGSHARPYEGGSLPLRRFEALVETLPDIIIPATEHSSALTLKCRMEHWIDDAVAGMLHDAQLRKSCKKGLTYARAPGDEGIYTINRPYTPGLAAKVRSQYPDAVVYNEHLANASV